MAMASERDAFVSLFDRMEYINFVSQYSAAMLGHSDEAIPLQCNSQLMVVLTSTDGQAEIGPVYHMKRLFKYMDKLCFNNSGLELSLR
jgi:glutamate-1-semialdehyde aminotransferase